MLADVVWDVGKIGKVAPVAVLEPVFVGGTTVTRATLANQEVIRARDVRIGDTVLVRRAGDVIPFVAGVLDASKRTGAEREIVPPARVPVVRAAADRAGQQPRAVLHQRRLPGADRAAADPLGLARGGRHRGGRPGVDRAPQRGRAARAPVGLLRARRASTLLEFDRIGEVSADRMIESIDAQPRRRPAPRADRPGDPDGLRGHRRRGCAAPAIAASRRSPTPTRRRCSRSRTSGPKVAASLHAHLNRDGDARRARAAARARRRPRRARRGPAAAGRRRRAAGRQDRRHHRHDRRPAQRREGPAARRSSACASARARRPPRRSRPAPTC